MITIIVNKTTTLTGITVETPSNVPTITPKGIIVITRILVVMTNQTEGIIRRILSISIILATTTTTISVREIPTPTGEVVENRHRVTMTAPQGNIIKGTIVANKIPRTGAVGIPTVVSTTRTNMRTNVRLRVVRLHGRPYALPTTLNYSRVAICASPKMWRQ